MKKVLRFLMQAASQVLMHIKDYWRWTLTL